jgi:hypothetical protein
MIFQIKDGNKVLVGEVNKINELWSGGKLFSAIPGRDRSFVIDGSKIVWDDANEFGPDGEGSIEWKFGQVDDDIQELKKIEEKVDELKDEVGVNAKEIEKILSRLFTDSDFLEFDDNGLHSFLSFKYNEENGELSLWGKEKDGNKLPVGNTVNLNIDSQIAYAGVHTSNGEKWSNELAYSEFTSIIWKLKAEDAEEDVPYLIIGYQQPNKKEVTMTAASLQDLIDVYKDGNGISLNAAREFSVVGGDGINVNSKGVNVLIDTKTGLYFNNENESEVAWKLPSFESILQMNASISNYANGSICCVIEN